jgi:3-phenylpropionate/trans-cinnamate dioxygenase ferredoxin reductase subunit
MSMAHSAMVIGGAGQIGGRGSDQYELTLKIAGFPEAAVKVVERHVGPEARLLFHLDADGRLVGFSGVGRAALARNVRPAPLMIERRTSPDPAALADPAVKLKGLLR